MKKYTIRELERKANDVRQWIIKSLVTAGSGHSAGPLGMADVFTALYFEVLNIDPKQPNDPKRDRLIMSNGHICPVLYAALALRGYFPVKELLTLRKINGRLQGHPAIHYLPGIENNSGPMGQGLSQAVGFALAARMDHQKYRIYVSTSDGEHDEGQTWEAVMAAAKFKLSNITAFMDRNNIQISGNTEDVLPLEPLREKYQAFGWHVIDVDGHNMEHIIDAFHEAQAIFEKPTMILCHTIPGKGVDFMEHQAAWHGIPPNQEQARLALRELRTLRGKITGEFE